MTFEDFVASAREGRIQELHIESLEGNIFLLRAFTGDDEHVLENADGTPLHPKSLGHARKLLIDTGECESLPLFLVQQTAYDEMIGLDATQESHKTPMTLHSGL